MKQFVSTYSNPKRFESEQIRAKQFVSTYSNPKRFESEYIATPTDLTVTQVNPGTDIYWPGTSIDCSVDVINSGASGSENIEWQVINTDTLVVLDSGSQDSGIINGFSSGSVDLTGITSPSGGDIKFKIRARIEGDESWVYSMQMANYIYFNPPENPTPRG